VGRFYPLPWEASESAIIYQKIPYGGPFILEFIHGGTAKGMAMLPSPNPPSIYDMVVNITSDDGVTLTLPDPKINVYPYFLRAFEGRNIWLNIALDKQSIFLYFKVIVIPPFLINLTA
jgi:hypothetical protein